MIWRTRYSSKFVYFLRERERARMSERTIRRGTERGKERILSRLRAASTEPSVGHELTNHEIMT